MKEKVVIPNRGIIALDVIHSLNSIGLETVLMHSPEDSHSLPVKMADRSYKFYSSRLEDSYLDMEAIIEKACEIKADYVHPGYGFLSENPEFAKQCRDNGIRFIGPEHATLAAVENKLHLRALAAELGVPVLAHSDVIRSPIDFDGQEEKFKYPLVFKPVKGSGGRGIRVANFRKEAMEQIDTLLRREEIRKSGLFYEEYQPFAHHIEIPFFRDVKENILFLPEIESSIQRRFQKIFQESPSPNINPRQRELLYDYAERILRKLNYVGLGHIEFFLIDQSIYFSEINPSFQINTLIPEVHIISNFVKKQFAISRGETLHKVRGVEIIQPKHSVMLVSLMAEDPFNNFQPSAGVVSEFFHYSTIRNIFKTTLYTGARITPTYDPFIGKILTFSVERKNALTDMRKFLDSIFIRGIRTNLIFLKHLLENEQLHAGKTTIDFLHTTFDFSHRRKSEEELEIAASLLAAAFHMDNRQNNYKAKLEKMKQPGFFKRLFGRM